MDSRLTVKNLFEVSASRNLLPVNLTCVQRYIRQFQLSLILKRLTATNLIGRSFTSAVLTSLVTHKIRIRFLILITDEYFTV